MSLEYVPFNLTDIYDNMTNAISSIFKWTCKCQLKLLFNKIAGMWACNLEKILIDNNNMNTMSCDKSVRKQKFYCGDA